MVDDPEVDKKSISDTPLGSSSASHLLSGLDVYEVCANDGHPISVYGINSEFTNDDVPTVERRPILLLHGRTWSAIPVYHLLGGDNEHSKDGEKKPISHGGILFGWITTLLHGFSRFWWNTNGCNSSRDS